MPNAGKSRKKSAKKPARKSASILAKKFDVYQHNKADYVTPKTAVVLEIKPARYLAIAGRGKPGDATFQAQLSALYAVAFTVKMASKSLDRDYTVSKLEGLWWGDDPDEVLLGQKRDIWNWKLLIRTPDFISQEQVRNATGKLQESGKSAEVNSVKLEELDEGRSVQMLHVGPYDAEAPTLQAMQAFAGGKGFRFRGLHHEIYLSDPRRVPPAKLKTILRHPIQ
jgi:hypothetical protein